MSPFSPYTIPCNERWWGTRNSVSERGGKLNVSPSVLGGSVLKVSIVLRACVFAVYTCVSNREDKKSNYKLLLLRGTPKANVSFPRAPRISRQLNILPNDLSYVSAYFANRLLLGAPCLHQFETVRARMTIISCRRSRTRFAFLFFPYKRNRDSSHTCVCILDQATNGSSLDTARN